MNKIKMSDVFENAVDLRLSERGHIYCRYNEMTEEALEYTEDAINAYDANQERIKELEAMLGSVSRELHMAIDEINSKRLNRVTPQMETPPDLWDMETLHDIQVLLNRGNNND